MSSTTPRVSLYKPAGGEDINVTTDLNNNLDKIDTNLNFRVVANEAARNAISPHWEGLSVRETDTGRCYVSNGTAPISGSWSEIVQANNTTVGEMLFGNLIRNTRATAADSGYETRVTGDTFARWYVQAGGTQYWGPGNATFDTNLYRSAANTLKTDDAFHAVGNLTVDGDSTLNGNVTVDGDLALAAGTTIYRNALSAQTTVANTASESIIAEMTIPANDAVQGAIYRITAWGIASVTGTPTLNIRAKFGGIGGSQFAQTGEMTASSGVTNKCWNVEAYVVILSTGVSGSIFGRMTTVENLTVAGTNPSSIPVTRIDGSGTSTQDTTIAKDLILTADWSVASASNTLTCRGYRTERVA